jgi:hypothetical protein
VLAQDGEKIVVRVALMQEHGLAGGGGDLELPDERTALQIARGEVAKIVQPAFSCRDHFAFSSQVLQLRECPLGQIGRMVRVHAGGGKQSSGMRARQLDGFAAAFHAGAGDDHLLHAGRGRPPHHRVAIGVETVVREVDADVD